METPTLCYSCAIIDDDSMSREILEHYIKRTVKLSLEASFTNPVKGIGAFRSRQEKIDFLFLYIDMEILG